MAMAISKDEALELLRGDAEGIAEWNRRREAGEEIPVLIEANLSGAVLSGADLRDADLRGAHVRGVRNLTQTQLEGVQPTPPPKFLPDGLTWPFVEKGGKWVKKE